MWYSVMQNNVVVGHSQNLTLRDARFIVRESGRQRVLKTGKKNVHAFVVGTPASGFKVNRMCSITKVYYNPKLAPDFIDDAGSSISRGRVVVFNSQVTVIDPE